MSNRLAEERSPYLLQHADNPVDWYPWGEDAFDKARREDKPIFLSIGYSTCHWCHVMAHESFEDRSVADVLNREFVSVKLDREERPDVDRVYMMFVQATTGAGGWPMSVWLTPDLKPFFGGTYFPPSARWGRPGFIEILEQLADAWRTHRADLVSTGEDVIARLQESAASSSPDRAPIAGAPALLAGIAHFAATFDERHGGFGGAPKFPRPSELLFLLHAHALTGDWKARTMALDTLRAMALGGMRDHVGGGFHRYSVDGQWRVPHFEKMLYDQAQLVLAYLEATQASGDEFFASVAEDTLAYVSRDLTASDGGFHSAEDADSTVPADSGDHPASHGEKKEGAFYVWSESELARLLGDDLPVVVKRFGIEPAGNALADPQGEFRGLNIPYIAQSIEDVAARTGRSTDAVTATLARARQVLFDARAVRPRPHLDDKVITAWNGLMIAAFARASRVLVNSPRRETWRRAAVAAATAVRNRLWDATRHRLMRRYRAGEAGIDAFCEDYAYLVWGLVELFQTTGAVEWLEWAREITAAQTALFFDEQDGGWFSTTGEDASVLLRVKEDYDGAEPAAASVTVRNLIALGHLTSDAAMLARAARTLERYGPEIGRAVRVMPLMVANIALWHGGGTQVVIAGDPGREETRALEAAVAARHLPWAVSIPVVSSGDAERLGTALPWIAAMTARSAESAAFVCHDFVCQAPVTDAASLNVLLEGVRRGKRLAT